MYVVAVLVVRACLLALDQGATTTTASISSRVGHRATRIAPVATSTSFRLTNANHRVGAVVCVLLPPHFHSLFFVGVPYHWWARIVFARTRGHANCKWCWAGCFFLCGLVPI